VPIFLFLALLTVEGPSSRSALLHGYRRSPDPLVHLVVLGASSPGMEEKLRTAARSLDARRQGTLTFLEASKARETDLARPGVVLVGTARSNPWIAKIASGLPVAVDETAIRLRGKVYDGTRDSLQLVYPSPFLAAALLVLVTGNSDEAVLEALGSRRRGDFQIRREGKTLVLGRFRDDWSLDPEEVRELESGDGPSLEDFGRRTDETRRRVAELFGPLPPSPELEVRLYPSLEHKGLVTDDTRPAHFDGPRLYAVMGVGTEPERLLAERLLEDRIADETLRRGVSTLMVASESELDSFDDTSFRLSRISDSPRLASVEEESPFVLEAMSASFARFVLRDGGPEALARPLADVETLERRWLQSLKADEPPPRPAPARFQRGMTLAHEGFEIHDGYLSARSDRSLDKLQSLEVDSVAIVPYAFMAERSRVTPLDVPERAGSETDEAVIHAIRAAKSRGMTVLLKPQIWLRRSWPGEIEPDGRDEEDRFFREYGRWIRHYALMAEKHGVELLAIGTELSKMTRGRTSRWEIIIRDIRVLYRGRLVYAANWGNEVEQVGFWPLLDFIGVDFYYPLSSEDSPSDEALRAGFESALDPIRALSRRFSKPVLLTEIGYTSTRSPWRSPHSSDRGREPSAEHQTRAYEAAFTALADETSWIRGTYFWKWPTDLTLGGAEDSGFTPNGKPAEEVVRRGYGSRIQ
jgi:hypothetical protein